MRPWNRRNIAQHHGQATANADPGPAADAARLWSHGIHEDNMFIQRGNFFLVAQSMLVVAYSAVLAAHDVGHDALAVSRVIAAFGLAISIIWILTGYLHLSYLLYLRREAGKVIPEFAAFRQSWQASGRSPLRKLDIAVLLAYAVPAMATGLWLVLLLLV